MLLINSIVEKSRLRL